MKQEPERSPMRPKHDFTAADTGRTRRDRRRRANEGLPKPDAAAVRQDAGAADAALRGPVRAAPAHARVER